MNSLNSVKCYRTNKRRGYEKLLVTLGAAILVEGRSQCWSAGVKGGREGEEAGMASVDFSLKKLGCRGKETRHS